MFQKGNKLGGRKAIEPKIKNAFAKATPEAIEILLDLMRNSKDDGVRLKAASTVIERHLGKVAQPISNDGDHAFVVQWQK